MAVAQDQQLLRQEVLTDRILYLVVLLLPAVAAVEVTAPLLEREPTEVLAGEVAVVQRLLVLEALETRRPLAQAKEVMVVVE